MKSILRAAFVFLAIVIGLYPVIYLLAREPTGILQTKSTALLQSLLYYLGFYTHILGGGVAMLTGWSQFSKKLRNRNLKLHRQLGKIYIISVVLSALAAIGIGFFATGGPIAATGFISLGLIWFYTTLEAYRHIRRKDTTRHRVFMIYSYAACFAAVTLRLYMPFLIMLFGEFEPAYRLVAWLCWVPNLAIAHFFIVKPASQNV